MHKSYEDAVDAEAARLSKNAAYGSPAWNKAFGQAVKNVNKTFKFKASPR